MKSIIISIALVSIMNAEDRLPERKIVDGSWITFHEGIFAACKCIRIIDYYPKFGVERNDVYECANEKSLAEARKWLDLNVKGLLNHVPSKPVGAERASRPRFVLIAYSEQAANEKSVMFEIPISALMKGFDRDEYEDLVEKWGALPRD